MQRLEERHRRRRQVKGDILDQGRVKGNIPPTRFVIDFCILSWLYITLLNDVIDALSNTPRETAQMNRRHTPPLQQFLLSVTGIGLMTILSGGVLGAAGPDYMAAMGIVRFDGQVDAPNFSLPTADGKSLQLHAFKGSVILLNFWAIW